MDRKLQLVSRAIRALLCGLCLSSAAFAQNLPDAPGKPEFIHNCLDCHSAGMVLRAKKTPEDWRKSVDDMSARGTDGSKEDMDKIVLYLDKYFAIDTPSRVSPAQEKGEPGKFDFYLLNLSWSPEFCSIHGTSPQCAAAKGFIVHGLWPQNNDGSYPVFCAERPGPAKPEANLDITPDLSLLKHEWDKHGTCTTMSPEAFFAAERKAFHEVAIPALLQHIDHELQMKPSEILTLFGEVNPEFPQGSILLSCGNNRLTAVEACLTKDLKPMVCRGLDSCHANVVKIAVPSLMVPTPAQ